MKRITEDKIRWSADLVINVILAVVLIIFYGVRAYIGGLRKHIKSYPKPGDYIPMKANEESDYIMQSTREEDY